MEDYILYLILALVITIIIGILTYFNQRQTANPTSNDDAPNEEEAAHQRERPILAATGPRNRAAANRNARARMRIAQTTQRQAEVHHSDSEGEEELHDDVALPEGKIGKKKLAKIQAKADKRVQREADEREREEKKEREEQKSELRKIKEKEEEDEAAKLEEEENKIREEEERKEREEYEKMRREFQIEEEGFDETLQSEQEKDLLNEFIDYIKATKVIILEDLASKFQLKTQVVINRINDLVKEGRLTGVIDDRGKFIFITASELASVAKFIRQRGRVSIADIAEASNSLINLTPDIITVDS